MSRRTPRKPVRGNDHETFRCNGQQVTRYAKPIGEPCNQTYTGSPLAETPPDRASGERRAGVRDAMCPACARPARSAPPPNRSVAGQADRLFELDGTP